MKTFKLNEPVKKTDEKWLNLFSIDYTVDDGKSGSWTFASRKKEPKLYGELKPDAVVIIPLLKDGRQRKLVTIKEFRIPIGDFEHSFPAGLYDAKETAENVAARELFEETGLKLTKILYCGPACMSSAGLTDESVVYVVCECVGEISTMHNEGTESIEVNVLDMDGIRSLRASGEKLSAKFLPFLLMFDAMNKITWPKHMRQL